MEAEETRQIHNDRLSAVRRTHAGAVWACFPCSALGLKLTSLEFRTAAKYWLGMPVYGNGADGTRSLLESSAGRISRHDALRDCFFEASKAAGLRPWKERGVDTSGHRPGDLFLPNWSLGRPLAVDVTVSHPSQATLSNQAREENSASKLAALRAASGKTRKHGARCLAAGVDFQPVVVCSFGGSGCQRVKSLSAPSPSIWPTVRA